MVLPLGPERLTWINWPKPAAASQVSFSPHRALRPFVPLPERRPSGRCRCTSCTTAGVNMNHLFLTNELFQHAPVALEKAAVDHDRFFGPFHPARHRRMRNQEGLRVTGARERRELLRNVVGCQPCDVAADARPFAGHDRNGLDLDLPLGINLARGQKPLTPSTSRLKSVV